jgi:alpha-tubulin suppressor-like RCC1 family protein
MRALALLSVLLLAACSGGLYDTAGLPSTGGNGTTCAPQLAFCANECVPEAPTQCGLGCVNCEATVSPPAGAVAACLPLRAPDGHGLCGYRCADGFLACSGGCCGATAVAAGDGSSYALLSDGTVRAWGANGAGQIGDGTTIERHSPAPVLLPDTAIALGAGSDHACAVLSGGAVRCWGSNTSGQVTGTSASPAVATPAATPLASGAVAVAVGASHTCALLAAGTVSCWGSNTLRQLTGAAGITGATAIAAGRRHTCVLAGGAVKCWGDNGLGQLGGTPAGDVATPIASGIQYLAAYADHTCAATGSSNGLAVDDALRCWGDVLGPTFLFDVPQLTPAIPMKQANQSTVRFAVDLLTTGNAHVCVRENDSAATVQCFGGDNASGQLGGTSIAPEATIVPLTDIPAAAAIASGGEHTCALLPATAARTTPGALRCWGRNDSGQLGDGSAHTPPVGTMVTPLGT